MLLCAPVHCVIKTQNEHGGICKYDSSDVALGCGTTSEGREINMTRYKRNGKIWNRVVKES